MGSEVSLYRPVDYAMVVMMLSSVSTDRDRKWPHVGRRPLLSHCVPNFVRCLVRGCCLSALSGFLRLRSLELGSCKRWRCRTNWDFDDSRLRSWVSSL